MAEIPFILKPGVPREPPPCPRRVGIQHPLKPAGVCMFEANLCDVQAQQLTATRRIITDLVQLNAEQSGRVASEDCRFMDLGCNNGQHDPACPVAAAVEWLERGEG